jgi:CDP-glycerol glycerophosphotransferase (TagB/SpsB family)
VSVARFASRALRRARILRPRIALLVAGGDAVDLDATLHAARAIARGDVAIVAAARPGSPDEAVARAHAAEDWRVRHEPTDDWSDAAARVAGLHTRYVVPLTGGDAIDATWLDDAVATLGHASLGVGAGLRIADPAAAVFTHAAWRGVVGARTATTALVAALAATPDAVRLGGAARRDPSGPGVRGMPDTRPELAGWLEDQELAARELGTGTPLLGAWATSVLAGSAQRFLEDAERFDDAQWSALRSRIADLGGAAADDGLARLPVEARVRVALAAAGRRDELVRFVADRRFDAGQFPTRVEDGAAYAVLPLADDLSHGLLRLSPDETALHTTVRRLRWVLDTLELEVFACIAGVDLLAHEPEITARLVDGDRSLPLAGTVESDREVTRWMGSHFVNHDRGVLRARVPLAALAAPGRRRLEVTVTVAGITRTGVVTSYERHGAVALLRPKTHDGVTVSVDLDEGFALVAEAGRSVRASQTATVIETLSIVDGRLMLGGIGLSRLELRGPVGVAKPSATEAGASWPLVHDPWGFGLQPLPPGRYVLAADGPLAFSDVLAAGLPEAILTDDHRVVVRHERRGDASTLVLQLGPALADDEVGPYCQRRLQEWYADPAHHELDDHAVYLQAYTGQNATDSPLAIAEELARTRPDLSLTWAVADGASRVPAGSSTVLWRSRAWYAALARSRHVVTNIELESWFRRRSGQQVLQTFHGYPSKAMGIGLWQQKNFTPTRIEQQLDRTSRNWTLLLTPTPEMDVHYRENYRYDGEILAAGYPRDDVLVGPDADAIRTKARRRLGIGDDTTAVLYAPTWRDDQATDFRSATLVDHLDVAAAAEALGPGYVLLLRGHRFMSAGPARGSRVLDVTTYPEVNDLILAADAAVLDYSSMRFDVALTGRPMVFLVPDLEDYATSKRGFLYDFAPTAPGPLARSSAEVIAALRDLDGVRARHREEYEQFNATYNRLQDGGSARRVVERFFQG